MEDTRCALISSGSNRFDVLDNVELEKEDDDDQTISMGWRRVSFGEKKKKKRRRRRKSKTAKPMQNATQESSSSPRMAWMQGYLTHLSERKLAIPTHQELASSKPYKFGYFESWSGKLTEIRECRRFNERIDETARELSDIVKIGEHFARVDARQPESSKYYAFLTDDVLRFVFEYFPVTKRIFTVFAQVSRQWRRVSSADCYWKEIWRVEFVRGFKWRRLRPSIVESCTDMCLKHCFIFARTAVRKLMDDKDAEPHRYKFIIRLPDIDWYPHMLIYLMMNRGKMYENPHRTRRNRLDEDSVSEDTSGCGIQ